MDSLSNIVVYDSDEVVPIEVSSGSLVTYNFHSRLLKKFHKPVRNKFKRLPTAISYDNECGIDTSHNAALSRIKEKSEINMLNNKEDIIKELPIINKFTKCTTPTGSQTETDCAVPDFSKLVSFIFESKNNIDYFDHEYFKDIKNCVPDVNLTSDIEEKESARNASAPLKCGICDKYACEHLSYEKINKRSSNREPAFFCRECSYTCRKLSNLRSHKQVHDGNKQFSCDKCNYTSNFINNLKSHKVIHSGEKPFSCNECKYVCGRPSNLKRHKLKHSKEKPYPCDTCSYMSKDLTGLKVHKLTHSGQKPFTCDKCSSSYITLKSLNHHKKKHKHKISPASITLDPV